MCGNKKKSRNDLGHNRYMYRQSASQIEQYEKHPLREKCLLFWSAFSRVQTKYREIRENTDRNNSEYGHLLCSDHKNIFLLTKNIDQPIYIQGDLKSFRLSKLTKS